MKRIVVTPAGRQRYLELLVRHLASQKTDFDEWQLWMNTTEVADIEFGESLAARYDWITTVYIPAYGPQTNRNICKFFPGQAADPDAVYVRLDDDVVWLSPTFLKSIFTYRIANPAPFLVYANIINNAVISYLHQHGGNVTSDKVARYECMDEVGWRDPAFAESLHRAFLERPGDPCWSFFERWVLPHYERVSINAISWLGSDFAQFQGVVGDDEEQWLSCDKPRQLGRPNVILGSAVCVHFSFYTQRPHLDSTDVLAGYAALAPVV